MKITFVSNYINHHQIPFCNALAAQEGVEFYFVQTEPMEQERIDMGWGDILSALSYVILAYDETERCKALVLESDVVIWGGAEDESMLKPRLEAGRVVFRYNERLYKTGLWKAVSPRGLWKKYHDHTKYRNKQVYLLCAGAYVPLDYSVICAYPGKMFRWGYFPATQKYDIEDLLESKRERIAENKGTKELLWAARFIDWKHPEMVIQLAESLAKVRDDFHVTMIGGGEMESVIRELIKQRNLGKYVTLAGYKNPAEVRKYMEEAHIYLVTSDRLEGWGAVLNEAMNSACATVSSHMIGAAPYLICQGVNGYMYRDGDAEDLFRIVNSLLEDENRRECVGRSAYETITGEWNAENAAQRFVEMATTACTKGKPECKWMSGPGSRTPILKESKNIPS